MKSNRTTCLTLTGQALEGLQEYLASGWKLACYSWGYAFIVKGN